MTTDPIAAAIEHIRSVTPAAGPWTKDDFDPGPADTDRAIATILNAVVAGQLISRHTLADALEAERAKVAAAYEAGQLRMRELCGDMVEREGHGLHVAIRYAPLTPADAQAALDKMLAEARLEGWRAGREAAAEIAAASGGVKSAPLNDGCGTVICQPVMGYAVAAHIRDLPEPKEASHDCPPDH